MTELKVGIVGCGKIADFHAKAILKTPGCRLVAACNRTEKKLKSFTERYGISGYLDAKEMVRAEHLDAVTICTPHPTHAALAVACLNERCHVLVEKPLAVSVAECDEMIKAAEQNKVLLGTLVQRRFYKPCLRIREAIDSGKMGHPVLGEAVMLGYRSKEYYQSDPWRGSWSGEGGGVLVSQASHQIDLLNWYMGKIESIQGHFENFTHPFIEVEDSACAVIRYQGGGMATLLASNCQDPALYGRVHIFGSNGKSAGVKTDGGSMFIAGVSEIEEPPLCDLWTADATPLERLQEQDAAFFSSLDDKMIFFHQKSIANFLAAAAGRETLCADGFAGRSAVEVCEAVYTMTKKGDDIWYSKDHVTA